MPDATVAPKEELQKRLRRIEGQVRGVARMVDQDRDCREVIQQLSAIKAATHQVSLLVARSYACQCMTEPADQAVLDDLINIMGKATQEG